MPLLKYYSVSFSFFFSAANVVKSHLPVWHVAPSYPVPVQSQVKLPTVLVQVPPLLHGVPVAHSSTSVIGAKYDLMFHANWQYRHWFDVVQMSSDSRLWSASIKNSFSIVCMIWYIYRLLNLYYGGIFGTSSDEDTRRSWNTISRNKITYLTKHCWINRMH